MQTKLPLVNEQWTRTHDTQTLNNTNTRRVTFANESVASVLFSEVESECGNDTTQWNKLMSVLSDSTWNFGILRGTKYRLLKIASDCKEDALNFSLATIQQHVYFRRTTRHLLAMLVNEAVGNVSVLCPLEQPGGGFRYQGDGGIVAPEASRDANTLRRALL
jgi:phosphoribosyl-AMP cyclohydrolase